MQLAKLIGMVDPGQAEQLEKEAATHQVPQGVVRVPAKGEQGRQMYLRPSGG